MGNLSHHDTPLLPEPKQSPTPALPEKIGKYKIEGFLAQGGMSLLYLALHPDTFEPIVIKVLSQKFLLQKEIVSSFLNEAAIIALTDHPNIVKLYDYGEWENGLYIAEEFIHGTSLRNILAHQPFPLRKALEIILQIAYALCHLHTHGVIHGDLKPENILITENDQVKLIDFGIAKMLSDQKGAALEGKIAGTPIYMSPEAKLGTQSLTFQSDIYSLGIIAYELVLGKITHGKVILSLAPRGIQKILAKALQPNIEDRYQDIVDFISDISTYLNSGEIEKDRQGSDYFFELYENLESLSSSLLIPRTPFWDGYEIGHADLHSMGLNNLYYECFDLGDDKIILLAEIGVKGGEGVVLSAMVKSTARTLLKNFPHDAHSFFTTLISRIKEDLLDTPFQIGCLFLNSPAKKFEFKQHGTTSLFRFWDSKSQQFLPPNVQQGQFKEKDFALIGGFFEETPALEKIFLETKELPPQVQSEAILRKLQLVKPPLFEEHPAAIVSINFYRK
jgi:eukaryotic-like serine/threonine-protein kinase